MPQHPRSIGRAAFGQAMLRTLSLLLPALMPSWRFFDTIGPSPRVEYALLAAQDAAPTEWRAYRPRPQRLSFAARLLRLFWNPRWNESLFLVSLAERLAEEETAHARAEIHARLVAEVLATGTEAAYLQFRLVFISRRRATLAHDVLYLSPVAPIAERRP